MSASHSSENVFKKSTYAGDIAVNMPWQRAKLASVKIGNVFRLVCSSRLVETATVLDHFDDHDGIPHVRYKLKLETPAGQSISEDVRVLAMSVFAERYESSNGEISAA